MVRVAGEAQQFVRGVAGTSFSCKKLTVVQRNDDA